MPRTIWSGAISFGLVTEGDDGPGAVVPGWVRGGGGAREDITDQDLG
ncbi:hypothetical protein ACWD3J_38880 [Streptomyces sp. NPDC002755]